MNFLALFTKNPKDGLSKRRLRSVLSEEHIEQLCEAFLQDLLKKIDLLPCDKKIVAYAGKAPGSMKNGSAASFLHVPQCEGDLGDRLQHYFDWSFSQGASKSIVIGSDSPTLPYDALKKAFDLLDQQDVVVGPSEDGGYYLIGMRQSNPILFQGISWGSERVWAQTLEKAGHGGLSVGTLDRWYDVDTPTDLRRLKRDLDEMAVHHNAEIPQRTHQVLLELVF